MNMNRVVIGVDVGKSYLDVCYPNRKKGKIENKKSSILKLVRKAANLGADICFEATGNYTMMLKEICWALGVNAVELDAYGARNYAISQGLHEKSDSIDCTAILRYGESLPEERYHITKPYSKTEKRLRDILVLRDTLVKMRTQFTNLLESKPGPYTEKYARQEIKKFTKQIEEIDAECEKAVKEEEKPHMFSERFLSVSGVGTGLTYAVLAYLPEIGQLDSKSVAKLCGLAPLISESGTIKKKAVTKRGRSILKRAFYMAAVSASQHNHILSPYYKRLIARGKPKKVALIAVARRLAVLLNNIAKYPGFEISQDPLKLAKAAKRKRVKQA